MNDAFYAGIMHSMKDGVGKKKLRGKRKKRITTIAEISEYLHIGRNTASKKMMGVDLYDLYSVFDFVRGYEYME